MTWQRQWRVTVSLKNSTTIQNRTQWWSDKLLVSFHSTSKVLSSNNFIVIPKSEDHLWIKTVASVRIYGISATLYTVHYYYKTLHSFHHPVQFQYLTDSKPCVTIFLSVISHQISLLAASTNLPFGLSAVIYSVKYTNLCLKLRTWLYALLPSTMYYLALHLYPSRPRPQPSTVSSIYACFKHYTVEFRYKQTKTKV